MWTSIEKCRHPPTPRQPWWPMKIGEDVPEAVFVFAILRGDSQSRQSVKLFLQSSELGHPQPLARKRVPPPPFGSGGRSTLAGEKVGGRVPIPTRGHTLWYSIYIRTLWSDWFVETPYILYTCIYPTPSQPPTWSAHRSSPAIFSYIRVLILDDFPSPCSLSYVS